MSIVFSQIHATGACFYEDGTLIKDKSDPAPVEPKWASEPLEPRYGTIKLSPAQGHKR